MNEFELNFIENNLSEAGVKYQKNQNFYQTFWSDNNLNVFSIILFCDNDFCHFSCQIEWEKIIIKEKLENIFESLNLLNLKFNGVKFVKDKLGHFIILIQEEMHMVNSENILNIFKRFVKIINHLYY